jgi:hypothetical protein
MTFTDSRGHFLVVNEKTGNVYLAAGKPDHWTSDTISRLSQCSYLEEIRAQAMEEGYTECTQEELEELKRTQA